MFSLPVTTRFDVVTRPLDGAGRALGRLQFFINFGTTKLHQSSLEFANLVPRRFFDIINTGLLGLETIKAQLFAVKIHHRGKIFSAETGKAEANDFEVLFGTAVRAPINKLGSVFLNF